MDASHSIPKLDSLASRWQSALWQREPNLPRPVIEAMVQNVVKSPLGKSLCGLEEALMQLREMDADTLTGSEARTVLAIFTHLRDQVEQIEAHLRELWFTPD